MHLRHRALFIGFAPAENPTIALAVVVEGGGYGSSTAAPIARKIFDAWLLGKMPEPDPKTLAAALAANPFANVVATTTSAPAAVANAATPNAAPANAMPSNPTPRSPAPPTATPAAPPREPTR
jgi:penicillin-binding protein 2